MSLRHALLGLLAQQPSSGFQLTKTFEANLNQWAWHTTHSRIYPELRRLEDAGLVEVVEQATRRRRIYALTAAGHAEFHRWMTEPSAVSETVRSEGALRMFLINGLDTTEARIFLRERAENASRRLQELHAQLAQAPAEWRDNPLALGRLAAERRVRTLSAVHDWALWAIDQIDRRDESRTEAHAHPSNSTT